MSKTGDDDNEFAVTSGKVKVTIPGTEQQQKQEEEKKPEQPKQEEEKKDEQ